MISFPSNIFQSGIISHHSMNRFAVPIAPPTVSMWSPSQVFVPSPAALPTVAAKYVSKLLLFSNPKYTKYLEVIAQSS